MSTLSAQLKESWALVEGRADQVAEYLYARLFVRQPALREMFPLHMDTQRERLMAAMARLVQAADSVEQLDSYLRRLGRDHRKYGVRPEHFAVFGECLIEAIRAHAGREWTAGHERAWRQAYRSFATRMIDGAAADAHNPAYWEAEVLTHERRTYDIAAFTVRPVIPLPYQAGQHVTIESPYRPNTWRPFPVANAPRADGVMEFHVRAAGDAVVGSSLVWKLGAGDILRMGPAAGVMTLDLDSPRDLVCVAGGTGLAPIKALVEELAKTNRTRWVHVFLGVRTREELYDMAALEALASRCPWLSLVPAVSDDPGCPHEQGEVSDVVASYGPWNTHDFYVCGSSAMVSDTLAKLRDMQVPPTRISHDSYPAG
ncbi:MAG: flavohemoprotein [Micromonosporaceae bacterium]|nr:flavohemoprotein [Micromonosporaceae bacterium]